MKTVLCGSIILLALAQSAFSQDWAKENLEKSPRHHEWVVVPNNDRQVHAFLVFPERKEKVPAVIIIHENRGLTDWVRSVADQVAAEGYIAIAPDLLSGAGPNGGRTADFPDSDAAREAIYKLDPGQVTADLNAVAKHVSSLPASNGKLAVGGFCWGGAQTFRFATNNDQISAAFVFYGTGPEDADAIAKITAPVYGFYGGNDARVNATIPKTAELMKSAGKRYEPVIYEGAGHGFMRSGQEPNANEANAKAQKQAWKRLVDLLKETTQ